MPNRLWERARLRRCIDIQVEESLPLPQCGRQDKQLALRRVGRGGQLVLLVAVRDIFAEALPLLVIISVARGCALLGCQQIVVASLECRQLELEEDYGGRRLDGPRVLG